MSRAHGFKSAKPIVDNENYNSWPSWSPDGQWISFMSHDMAKGISLTSQIYKVKVSDRTIVQLTDFPNGTVLGDSTSWSPDGRIAFEHDNDIYSVSELGGSPLKLIDPKPKVSWSDVWGAEWSPDGSRLAFRGTLPDEEPGAGPIWVTDHEGRHAFQETQGHADENPSWLDNQHILFERWMKNGEVRICLVSLPTSKVTCLTKGHVDLSPSADPSGRRIFFARGNVPPKEGDEFPSTHIYALSLAERLP